MKKYMFWKMEMKTFYYVCVFVRVCILVLVFAIWKCEINIIWRRSCCWWLCNNSKKKHICVIFIYRVLGFLDVLFSKEWITWKMDGKRFLNTQENLKNNYSKYSLSWVFPKSLSCTQFSTDFSLGKNIIFSIFNTHSRVYWY